MRKVILNETFGIIALALLLIPQVAHTVYVFKVNSHYDNPWFSWCYALGIDLAILIFTVKGWIRTAIVYFLGTLAHNLVYQFLPDSLWSASLICLMLSGTILSFSHLFFQHGAVDRSVTATDPQPTALEMQISAALKAGIRFEVLPYQCPACGEAFASSKKLNGHISGHKQKEEWSPQTYNDWEAENEKRSSLLTQVYDVLPNANHDDRTA